MADIEGTEARQRGRGERRPVSCVASTVRPGSVANIRGLVVWPTSWPDSMASIVRPGSVADIGGPTAWPTSRPATCVADFKARQLRG